MHLCLRGTVLIAAVAWCSSCVEVFADSDSVPTQPAAELLSRGACAQRGTLVDKIDCLFEKLYTSSKRGYQAPGGAGSKDVGDSAVRVYGEVLPTGVESILRLLPDDCRLAADDVFFDLGSGLGKFAVQVFLTTPVRRSVGVEIAEYRHAQALQALVLLQRLGTEAALGTRLDAGGSHVAFAMGGRDLRLEKGDILLTELQEATVVFIANLAFPPDLMEAVKRRLMNLRPGTIVILLAKLVGCSRGLLLQTKAQIDASWSRGRTDIYVYIATTPKEDAEVMSGDGPVAQKVPEGKWGGTPAQLRRLRRALSQEPRDVAFHRERGGKRSAVMCDAQELIAASAQGDTVVEAILAEGAIDLTRQDDQQNDVLGSLKEELVAVEAAAGGKFAAGSTMTAFRKNQEEKAKRILALISRVTREMAAPSPKRKESKEVAAPSPRRKEAKVEL